MNSVLSRYKRLATIGAVAIAGTILLSSCAANEGGTTTDPSAAASALTGTLVGAGASSQGSAQEAWVAAFQTENPDVTINYDPTGSGAGRETFIGGGSDFAGSDSALKKEEIAGGFKSCVPDTGYIEVPAFIDPIAVIFNVAGVDKLNLDAATLAKIFKGEITSWDDPAIAALNEGTTFPSAAITAVHRSDDSGTTKNFADYLNKVAPDVWDAEPADPFPYATGEGAQGTSGVVAAVTDGVNTIGYAAAGKIGALKSAAIKVGDKYVAYSAEAAASVVDGSPVGDTNNGSTDLSIKLDRKTTDPSQYPLVLVSYLIACNEYVNADVAPLVSAYLTYVTSQDGQALAASDAGAAPLSSALSDKVATALKAIK